MKLITQIIEDNAAAMPHKIALHYLDAPEGEREISYADLVREYQNVAANLMALYERGERIIIITEPSVNFSISFLAVIAAGMIPVPCYPPVMESNAKKLEMIVEQSGAVAVIGNKILKRLLMVDAISLKLKQLIHFDFMLGNIVEKALQVKNLKNVGKLRFLDIESLRKDHSKQYHATNLHNLGLIQYTSGTTSTPKGVCVTNTGLVNNLKAIQEKFTTTSEDIGYQWLPPYHDMGLIGGILHPLFLGSTSYFVSPITFIKNPLCWLKHISECGITVSGGPNFAYSICNKYSEASLGTNINLESWRVAFCGAEPINKAVIEQFSKKFKPYGFNKNALLTCYGLAESTLIVTGEHRDIESCTLYVNKHDLCENKITLIDPCDMDAVPIVSSGTISGLTDIEIRDFTSEQKVGDDIIGKIYVSGDCLAEGYWDAEDITEEAFIKDDEGNTLFDSGDCGATHDGRLFVLGRYKDLVIFEGKNYYVSAIEKKIEGLSRAIRPGCVCIIQSDLDDSHIIVLAELRSAQDEETLRDIAKNIYLELLKSDGLPCYAVNFLKKKNIPKTSSGKISRSKALNMYQEGQLASFSEIKIADLLKVPGDDVDIDNMIDTDDQQLDVHIENTLIQCINEIKKSNIHYLPEYLHELDVSSLEVIQISILLEAKLDIENLSEGVIFTLDKCEDLKKYLKSLILNEHIDTISHYDINHSLEKYINATLSPAIIPKAYQDEKNSEDHVLVTGACGYLGAFLVKELLQDEHKYLHCIIRKTSDTSIENKFEDALKRFGIQLDDQQRQRIALYEGDCDDFHFGLSPSEYQALSAKVDKIFNSAADVNFLSRLEFSYKTNAKLVERVLDFACNIKQKSVFHISTFSTAYNSSNIISPEAISTKKPKIEIGYVYSKWLGEKLAYEGMERGIDVNIFRPSIIHAHSTQPIYNNKDLQTNLLICSIIMGCYFPMKNNIALLCVDDVAKIIAKSADINEFGNIYTIINTSHISINDIVAYLQAHGLNMEEVTYEEWIERAQKASEQDPDFPGTNILPLLKSEIGREKIIREFLDFSPEEYQSENLTRLMQQTSVELVSSDVLIKNFINNFIQLVCKTK